MIYGEPNDSGFIDDTGSEATSLAPSPGSGLSAQRLSDGYDTDASGDDFVVQVDPTPGASNTEIAPVVCVPDTGDIVINEFLPDPEGSDSDAESEWVELYNNSSSAVSIDGWKLSFGTQDFEDRDVELPGGLSIEPGGYFVIGNVNAPVQDFTAPVVMGSGSEGDGVRLFDCEDTVVDTVVYGEENADGLPDDVSEPGESIGDAGEGQAYARVTDGVDTDSVEDWRILVIPTPGEENKLDIGSGGDDPIGGRGCGCGGGPSNTAPDGRAPGEGGCATVPAPVTGLAWVIAMAALRRRRTDLP